MPMSSARILFASMSFFALFQSCRISEPLPGERVVNLDTLEVNASTKMPVYRASEKRINDLLHTKLEVSFDWDSTYLYGKASLDFKPYFYPTDSLLLDAKGFQILEVALIDSVGKKKKLEYTYDSLQLAIQLDRSYTRADSYSIFIDYIAMPNKLDKGGSEAITSDIGLYFINPQGKDSSKPRQIWTQGETEASSCWFPTIDSPNERMSQEIYITVDTQYISLSNGTLMFQTVNGDGTRTDYWKQDLPDAPYLTMMAIGEFAKVEDQWRNKAVNYYVEPEYEHLAREIYPHTVEMIEFFSNQLDLPYPWDKFDQIVVRDYVSGAMENTSAVIYGDFIQGNQRYLIDNSGEDIVAHELYHHWFGDLVTTESWSNLPLNESFATYGEYLWNEHKYGKDQADYGLQNDLQAYLQEAAIQEKSLIRFYYDHRMEMFDRHSYQKGGRVLHMLRKYVGDEAFFLSLKKYLEDNAYQSVEIHNLRLAFEEITGEDLNWFFSQWFMEKGHPILKVEWDYEDSTRTVRLFLKQMQQGEGIVKAFQLPMYIDIYCDDQAQREEIRMDQREQEFYFKVAEKPILLNVDAEKVLLAEFIENKSPTEWNALYKYAGNYLSRYEAINNLEEEVDSVSLNTIQKGLGDNFWGIRKTSIQNMANLAEMRPGKSLEILEELAVEDPKSDVRAAAIEALGEYFVEEVSLKLLQQKIQDSSYLVVSTALTTLFLKGEELGLLAAEVLEDLPSDEVKMSIAKVYASAGTAENHQFFIESFDKVDEYSKYTLASIYGEYLIAQGPDVVSKALPVLVKETGSTKTWWIRMAFINNLKNLKAHYEELLEVEEKKLSEEKNTVGLGQVQQNIDEIQKVQTEIQESIVHLREKENNENLLRMLENI